MTPREPGTGGHAAPAPGQAIRVAVLTVSDRRASGNAPDTTGPAIAAWVEERGWIVELGAVVPDEPEPLVGRLSELAESGVDLVLTTGGTGLGARDRTPEATLAVAERIVPGIPEWIRSSTGRDLPAAYLSRGVAVIRGRTLIVNLPGSPRAVREYLALLGQILPHALAQIRAVPGSSEADSHPS